MLKSRWLAFSVCVEVRSGFASFVVVVHDALAVGVGYPSTGHAEGPLHRCLDLGRIVVVEGLVPVHEDLEQRGRSRNRIPPRARFGVQVHGVGDARLQLGNHDRVLEPRRVHRRLGEQSRVQPPRAIGDQSSSPAGCSSQSEVNGNIRTENVHSTSCVS